MRPDDLTAIETKLLLEGIFQHYGYDFRNYTPGLLQRKITQLLAQEGVKTISGLQEKIFHEPHCIGRLLEALSIGTTAMFRDPAFFLAFREKVVPSLASYPFIRIWHAGCARGEEVYSMAILLHEEKLYKRCRIYATDLNDSSLQAAQAGIFPLADMQEYTRNYILAGGKAAFSEYYTAHYGNVFFRTSLKQNIVFAQHNLVTDGSFNEFQAIVCRNVLIYFNKSLQDRVHDLFYKSLAVFGVLGLGSKETIQFTPHERDYEQLPGEERWYKKIR